jgi:hypothetical protein
VHTADRPLDDQTLFDLTWQDFIVDRVPPGTTSNTHLCSYRTREGNRCAIGRRLPDTIIDWIEAPGSADTSIGTLLLHPGEGEQENPVAAFFSGCTRPSFVTSREPMTTPPMPPWGLTTG